MCVKSGRHSCFQSTLIWLLVLCVLLFALIALYGVSVYLLTDSASILTRSQRQVKTSDHESELVSWDSSPAGSVLVADRTKRDYAADHRNHHGHHQPSISDQLVEYLFNRNCTFNRWMVETGQLLNICPEQEDPLALSDRQFVECLHTSHLSLGLISLVPLLLVSLSLAAVCRLLACPLITLAIVYLLGSIALVCGIIFYRDGAIPDTNPPLLAALITEIALYLVLALSHIVLVALLRCDRVGHNGDNEKIVRTDDEDELDDPSSPLYKKNGFSPQKKNDFEEKIKEFKYIDDDMSYIYRRG